MSKNLYWKPVLPNKKYDLPDMLRYVIAKKIWGNDGTLTSEGIELDSSIVLYLEGLRDAGVAGAEELIEAINKYEKVEIWISE